MLGLSDKEIEALRMGTWEIPCFSMELRRRDDEYVFSGSGIIRQNKHRQLAFTLLDTQNAGGLKKVLEELSKPALSAGQIIPEGHYYELRAVDTSGNVWQSTPTLDAGPEYGTSIGVVASGNIGELRRSEDLTDYTIHRAKEKNEPIKPFYENSHWHYYCFGDVGHFPCNAGVEKSTRVAGREIKKSSSASVSQVETDAFKFELQKDDGVVKFSVQAKNGRSYPDNTELRFVEALQFVLGRPFDWEVMEIFHGNAEKLRIRPLPTEQPRIRMLPPLAFDVFHYCAEFWELFIMYLLFILPNKDATWHAVSSRLFTIQHSQTYLWNIRMLTLGVEVEGLLNEQYPERVSGSSNIATSIDCVLSFLEDAAKKQPPSVDVDSYHRIRSSLGHLKGSSPINKLKKLVKDGVVRQTDVDAWEYVRNKSAHAMRGETSMSQENSQRLDRVLVLFYHLVFNLVGYKGKFTDYGEFGYPVKEYALQ